MKTLTIPLFITLIILSTATFSQEKNDFKLDNSLIPADQIFSGGPPRDGIPAIDSPKFIAADKADYLEPDDRILGININGEARAYPISILNWHEIVNDKIGSKAIAVTFCPLCGSGIIYSAMVDGNSHQFGVSGLLFNSDVLLYDRETESLWSQILSKSISGKMAGKPLKILPSSHTSWKAWKHKHPKTKVLSRDTGFSRDYDRSPYGSYTKNKAIYFPLSFKSKKYHPKERVLGITIGDKHKVYPFSELAKVLKSSNSIKGEVIDHFAGQELTLLVDTENRDGKMMDAKGNILPSINTFWFSWFAFHPDAEIFNK